MSLVSHILATVEQTTGIKLLSRASFAAMGVDSLGAVLFIKRLSDSLGGLRIEPKKLYMAGMTIKRFASELQEELLKNNPDVLIKLKCAHYASAHDVEQGDASKGGLGTLVLHEFCEEDDENSDTFVETLGSKIEEDFSFNCLAGNRKMFEGLRGLFTFMVLAGHYFRYPGTLELENFCSYCTKGDVFLFVMLTGFSTSLQLRLSPKFGVDDEGKRVLLNREPFNWRAFLLTRCLGLFPILWIALMLNIPIWYRPDLYSDGMSGPDISSPSSDTAKVCMALYIIGMQSWYRPKCHYIGPNSTVYASSILNIFIIYSMFRLIVRFVQDWLMVHREEHFVLPCEEDEAEAEERDQWGGHRVKSANRTWLQWAGNAATIASFSRYNTEQALVLTGLWFICAFFPVYKIFTDAAWEGKQTQNAIFYSPYYLLGTAGASLMEAWHSSLWHRNRDSRQPWRRKLSAFIYHVYAFTNDLRKLDGSIQEPSAQGEKLKISPSSTSLNCQKSQVGLESGPTDTAESDKRNGETCKDDGDRQVNSKPLNSLGALLWGRVVASVSASVSVPHIPERGAATCLALYAVKMFWRFYPDLLFIGSACISLQVGWLAKVFYKPRPNRGVGDSPEMVIWFIGLPLVTVIYTFIVCLQRGSARHNFSRLFFESPLMTFIGAASYPVYLLQAVMFEYYAPRLYYTYFKDDPSPPFAYSPNLIFGRPNGGQWQGMWWFSNLHWGIKFICFMILVVIGWLIQRIIQDRLVTFLYLKALVAYRRVVTVQAENSALPQREEEEAVTSVAVM
jgi:peptidoglycan/LPS O-acetylase OafA/YrhL